MRKFLFLLTALIVFSCSEDKDSSNQLTSVEDDQQNIENSIDLFYGCMQSMEDGDFSDFLLDTLFDNSGEFDDAYLNTIFDTFEDQYGDLFFNDRFQFSNRVGIYTWNKSESSWDFTANANKITFNFPSKENTTSNDMEVSVNSYSDTKVSYDAESIWMPTAVNVTMKHNNVELFTDPS